MPVLVDAPALVDAYDAALFDLDGVVYLGPVAVPGAAEALRCLRNRGTRIGFVTNNAARPPVAVAEHLAELGIAATADDVVTSAQAGAQLVAQRFEAGSRVLAVGGPGVWQALEEVGLVGVDSADERPVAVLQGFGFDLTWNQLNEAAIAIQQGAHWVATNIDPTRPTDRGIVPGNGAAVDAVRQAVAIDPEVAGKPYRPLVDATVARLGAAHPIFVGDRLDTDIAGAASAGLDSLLVLTGAHGAAELVAATRESRPTHVGYDLRDLLAPPRVCRERPGEMTCGEETAVVDSGRIELVGTPGDTAVIDALWAAATLSWRMADLGRQVDATPAVRVISALLARR
jgi:glycerol 3-phosphatase-2